MSKQKEKISIYQTVAELDARIAELKEERETLITQAQEECIHPNTALLETSYAKEGRPFRVCTICGRAEEGWGSGYWKLAANGYDLPRMGWEMLHSRYVLRFNSQEDMDIPRYGK